MSQTVRPDMPGQRAMTIETRFRIVRAIMYTEERRFDCSDTLQMLSHYIERELDGNDASTELPDLASHLIRCQHCEAVHEALYELAELELQGCLPDLSQLWSELERCSQGQGD